MNVKIHRLQHHGKDIIEANDEGVIANLGAPSHEAPYWEIQLDKSPVVMNFTGDVYIRWSEVKIQETV